MIITATAPILLQARLSNMLNSSMRFASTQRSIFTPNDSMDSSSNTKEKIHGMVQDIQPAGVKPEAFPNLTYLGKLQK
jgi:hypothetical protein